MRKPLSLVGLPVLLVSACGAAAPGRDAGDVIDFRQEVAYLQTNTTRTAVADLPVTSTSGFVRYNGELGADILINGTRGYGILGDLQMDVGFAGARDVDGTVSNIDLLINDIPNQQLRGSLDITGQQASGKIDAAADGVLSRTTDANFDERTNLHLELTGTVRTDIANGDTILGTVNNVGSFGDGTGTGLPPLRTFNVLLDGDGDFYGWE